MNFKITITHLVSIPALDRLVDYLDAKDQAQLDSLTQTFHTDNVKLETATKKGD